MNDSRDIRKLSAYGDISKGDFLFENSITAMMLVDENRRIIVVNKRFCRLFGYVSGEVIGLQTSILTPSLSHFEEYKKFFERTRSGSIESSELQYKKKTGELFWAKLTGVSLSNKSEKYILWSFDDITAEVEARMEIQDRYHELDIIFNKVPSGLIYVVGNVIERVNPSFLGMVNKPIQSVLGRLISDFLEDFEQEKKRKTKKLVMFYNGRESITVEREIEEVSEDSYIVLLMNVTKHIQEKKVLLTLAQTDGLTKIFNRSAFLEMVQEMITDPSRESTTLVMFDIDNFKQVNDTYGHNIGDNVLVELSDLFKGHLREDEIFGRLGGEEFGIAFPVSKEKTILICRRLLKLIRSQLFTSKKINVTISMGVSDSTFSNVLESVYEEADRLLYRAKRAGRDRLEF
ncbi:sensor domain-containing diguanylate cyclase [Desulforhopalus sp. 52FAK]